MATSTQISTTEKQARFEYLTAKLVIECSLQGIVIICYRYRSTMAEDLAYYRAGLSEIDPTKTATKHMLGLAKDFAIAKGNAYDWNDTEGYKKMGEIAESLGLKWGGRWKIGDYGHVEYQEET